MNIIYNRFPVSRSNFDCVKIVISNDWTNVFWIDVFRILLPANECITPITKECCTNKFFLQFSTLCSFLELDNINTVFFDIDDIITVHTSFTDYSMWSCFTVEYSFNRFKFLVTFDITTSASFIFSDVSVNVFNTRHWRFAEGSKHFLYVTSNWVVNLNTFLQFSFRE